MTALLFRDKESVAPKNFGLYLPGLSLEADKNWLAVRIIAKMTAGFDHWTMRSHSAGTLQQFCVYRLELPGQKIQPGTLV